MGLADYMSRNPSEPEKPPCTYDENFIIAQIDVIKETLHILRKRGRPKKHNNNTTQHNTKATHSKSNISKANTKESSHDSNNPLHYQPKRQRSRPRKAKVELSNDSTQIKNNTNKRGTITNNLPKNNKYNLRTSHKRFQPQLNTTSNDVTNNTQDTQQTITQAHLPINIAIIKQPNSNKQLNLTKQIEHTMNNPGSASAKSLFSENILLNEKLSKPHPKTGRPPSHHHSGRTTLKTTGVRV